jgi:RNA polymerase sigma factor (TIGR02999 family)
MALASQTMRRLLVDYARSRKRLKRGGEIQQLPLDDVIGWLTDHEAAEVLSLDQALQKLDNWDRRAARVVELHFFGGLSFEEIGDALGVSAKTVQRTWVAARAWLRKEIDSEPHSSAPRRK